MNRVYVVTSGCYSDYHIEAVFSDKKHAEIYANLDSDRRVEPYTLDNVKLESKATLSVCYDIEKECIKNINVDEGYSEPRIDVDYYCIFSYSVSISGMVLEDVQQHGMQSKMLLKITRDMLAMELDKRGTSREELVRNAEKKRIEMERQFMGRHYFTASTAFPENLKVAAELKQMIAEGKDLPDAYGVARMIDDARAEDVKS